MDSRHISVYVREYMIDIALTHVWNLWSDAVRHDIEYLGTRDGVIQTTVEWKSNDRIKQLSIGINHVHSANLGNGATFKLESTIPEMIMMNGFWVLPRCRDCGTIAIIGPFINRPSIAVVKTSFAPTKRDDAEILP